MTEPINNDPWVGHVDEYCKRALAIINGFRKTDLEEEEIDEELEGEYIPSWPKTNPHLDKEVKNIFNKKEPDGSDLGRPTNRP